MPTRALEKTVPFLRVGGMLVGYYLICPRKAWLVMQGVTLEDDSEQVVLGRLIHETSYRRERKSIDLSFLRDDGIELVGRVDWVDLSRGVLHETKKGRAMERAHRLQLAFYLWLLELCEVEVAPGEPFTGIIDYPLLRQVEEI